MDSGNSGGNGAADVLEPSSRTVRAAIGTIGIFLTFVSRDLYLITDHSQGRRQSHTPRAAPHTHRMLWLSRARRTLATPAVPMRAPFFPSS
jgi:hypothetical protein